MPFRSEKLFLLFAKESALLIRGDIAVAHGILEVFECLALRRSQILRDFNDYAYILIASAARIEILNALALEGHDGAGLSAGGQVKLDLAVNGRHHDAVAQSRLDEVYLAVIPDVIALAFKERVRSDEHGHMKIAGGTSVRAHAALAAHGDDLSVVDTGGDIHLEFTALGHTSAAAALLARLLDNFAFAAAPGTGLGGRNNTERCSLLDIHLTSATAVGAGLGGRALLGTRAAAVGTGLDAVYLYLAFAALRRLFK